MYERLWACLALYVVCGVVWDVVWCGMWCSIVWNSVMSYGR